MGPDAERDGPRWAEADDPRASRFGRFLRRSRLDEFPQFWNVLRGEMSLVGPRPERPEFVAELVRRIPSYRERLLVRPGVSGWAQVNYRYGGSVDGALDKLEYDLYYIKHRSFWAGCRDRVAHALDGARSWRTVARPTGPHRRWRACSPDCAWRWARGMRGSSGTPSPAWPIGRPSPASRRTTASARCSSRGSAVAASGFPTRRPRAPSRGSASGTRCAACAKLDAMERVTAGLAAAGIPSLILKGLPLGQRAYGRPFAKSSIDIDLLVPEDAFSAAAGTLRALGWRRVVPAFRETPARMRWYDAVQKEHVYTGSGSKIELHRRLLSNRFLFDPPFDRLDARALTVAMGVADSGRWAMPISCCTWRATDRCTTGSASSGCATSPDFSARWTTNRWRRRSLVVDKAA